MSTPFTYAPGSHSFLAEYQAFLREKGKDGSEKGRELKGRPDTQANSFQTLNTSQGKKGYNIRLRVHTLSVIPAIKLTLS